MGDLQVTLALVVEANWVEVRPRDGSVRGEGEFHRGKLDGLQA